MYDMMLKTYIQLLRSPDKLPPKNCVNILDFNFRSFLYLKQNLIIILLRTHIKISVPFGTVQYQFRIEKLFSDNLSMLTR